MKLIVGLGNPGRDYRDTRHNAGFMVVERLAERHGLAGPRARFHASVLEGPIAGEKVLLMEPTTYMNRSGLAVGEAVGFYKLDLADLLIVVDDVALPVGAIRLRPRGSAGGHNGLADVARALGTDAYPRLRLGIGAPEIEGRRIPQIDYVLGKFTDEQWADLKPGIDRAADAVETWIEAGVEEAMNKYNVKTA